jgi:hypothetical protein
MIVIDISGEILSLFEISLQASTVFKGIGLSFNVSFVSTDVILPSLFFKAYWHF